MLMQTKSNLRAQSRGDSGFARVFTIMAMLLLMSTGAWAEEWIPGITNGDFSGDDVSSFCMKVYPSTEVVPVVIGANVGKDGTPGIVVKSGDDTANQDAQHYDTQLWIVLPEEIPAGSTILVHFDYKASKANVMGSTEFHADPKSYLTWNALGQMTFTTAWKTFSGEFTVPNDADGMKSIAFNLQHEKSATDYYFDNFSVSYKKSEWTNIVANSDMEGTDVSCFYVKDNALGSDNIYLAHITDGIGKDDSRAIRVRSTGNEEYTWDTQFFIRLPYELPAGTKYRLSFDHKASKNIKSDFQCANEPKEYIIWYIGENDEEDFSFTTEWQHYKRVYNVPSVCNGEKHNGEEWLDNFQTIYFSLAMDAPDGEATEYIIDNVKVEILNSVLPSLTLSPVTDPKLMVAYPPYTVSLAEGTVDAENWTITPAEGAYEGETVTVTYSGTKHVKSVKAVVKGGAAPAGTNLSDLTGDYTAQDGDVLTGEIDGSTKPYKISIADGATVTLAGVTINGVHNTSYTWAGLNCEGDATIILADGTDNTVKGFHQGRPGILVPSGKTLTIKCGTAGTGTLTASSNGKAAGIGGGSSAKCGNISIEGGFITATGGNGAAGIGGGGNKSCGNISITGGTVTATGGDYAAGIGGGTTATCGTITIANTVTKVTATKGANAPCSIGASLEGTCGTITIGGQVYANGVSDSPYTYQPSN